MASIQPYSGLLDKRLAKHFLRRTSYRYTPIQIDMLTGLTTTAAVNALFNIPAPNMAEPVDYVSGQPWINSGVDNDRPNGLDGFEERRSVIAWWQREALLDTSIGSKMTFFLHSNFVVSADPVSPEQYFDYLQLLRYYATGNFKTLAKKITIDTAMLRYLNGNLNERDNPNENYAREFLELFTIGKGPQIGPGDYTNYTEADIVTAARVLTGWRPTWDRPVGGNNDHRDPDTGITRGRPGFWAHDLDNKTFSAAFNNTIITAATNSTEMFRELDDFVEMVFAQQETARNICRKLYRYFVSSNITEEIETDIIGPLSLTFYNNDYELEPVLRQLLMSQHFYDLDDNDSENEFVGGTIKSPFELLAQTMTFFDIQEPDPIQDGENHYFRWYYLTVDLIITKAAGMGVFQPENVAGYAAYYQEPAYDKNWFGGSTLIARYKLPEILLTGQRVLSWGGDNGGVQLNISQWMANSGVVADPADAEALVTDMIDYLFPEPPESARYLYFLNDIFLDGLSTINWRFEWLGYEGSGNDSSVKIPLERLFTALISSQEFQNN